MMRSLKRWFWDWGAFWLILAVASLWGAPDSPFAHKHGWATSVALGLSIASVGTWVAVRFSPGRKAQGK